MLQPVNGREVVRHIHVAGGNWGKYGTHQFTQSHTANRADGGTKAAFETNIYIEGPGANGVDANGTSHSFYHDVT